MAYRVCADHLRLLSFAIADGAVPNNTGRGDVVRRVLRRGVRYARKYLKAEIGSFFSTLLPALVDEMGQQFPELRQKENDIKAILNEEEVAFALTLDRGERQFEKYAEQALKADKKLAGSDVWRLYDTFGFPEDLTKTWVYSSMRTRSELQKRRLAKQVRLSRQTSRSSLPWTSIR
ncbi:tRNA synthetases class II (A)-domain-containing protein [Ustulina deusta]|nr:tRNA synthetases class II (A)-domain-containing protein [Ustulina deusta]